MKRLTEYILSIVFSVFFLLGGTGFTLSHYCCDRCKAEHCAIERTDCSRHDGERKDSIRKKHSCCTVQHFEVSNTETSSALSLPEQAEQELQYSGYASSFDIANAYEITSIERTDYSPPLRTEEIGKKVLRQVCRWLI